MCLGSPKPPPVPAPPPPPPADAPRSPALNENTSASANASDLTKGKRAGKSSLVIPLAGDPSSGSGLGIPT